MVSDTRGTMSVEQLAECAGVHRVHLARVFRDHYGVSVSTYIRKVRVQNALALMARRSMSLSELAFTAGFADQSHLTREIRAATGETPGMLRAMLNPFKT
jgi:AraC family transcriptional regulator